MSLKTAICEHPGASVYLDEDELKCRVCGRSVTFPGHPPGPQERRQRNPAIKRKPRVLQSASCLQCRRVLQFSSVDVGPFWCLGCESRLLLVDSDGNHGFPPFTPPRDLECGCCHRMLPAFCFYADASRPGRDGRHTKCRRCFSVTQQAKRVADPETHRGRARNYSRKNQAERVAGERPQVHSLLTPEQKSKKAQATTRHRARGNGQAVPKQRPGRNNIYLKEVCRISRDCPLARFCTTDPAKS